MEKKAKRPIDANKLTRDLLGIRDMLTAAGDPFLASVINRAIKCVENQPTMEERRWIPVTERMPEEHESIVPNWGTVSKPVLVAFVCTTSEEPYPQNCVVCETMSHNGVFTHKSYSGEYKAIAWMPKPSPPKEATP